MGRETRTSSMRVCANANIVISIISLRRQTKLSCLYFKNLRGKPLRLFRPEGNIFMNQLSGQMVWVVNVVKTILCLTDRFSQPSEEKNTKTSKHQKGYKLHLLMITHTFCNLFTTNCEMCVWHMCDAHSIYTMM